MLCVSFSLSLSFCLIYPLSCLLSPSVSSSLLLSPPVSSCLQVSPLVSSCLLLSPVFSCLPFFSSCFGWKKTFESDSVQQFTFTFTLHLHSFTCYFSKSLHSILLKVHGVFHPNITVPFNFILPLTNTSISTSSFSIKSYLFSVEWRFWHHFCLFYTVATRFISSAVFNISFC